MLWNKEVADIEVYPTLFVYVGHGADNEESYEYSLHSSYRINNIGEFCDRMHQQIAMIGFNIVGYDYPVLHYIFNNRRRLEKLSSSEVCLDIYMYSKALIEADKDNKIWINPKDYHLPLLDLFLIKHYNNRARSCGLKHIEVALRMDSIEDLPYPPDEHVTIDKVQKIIDYCHHDVKATKLFYKECITEVKFRQNISKTYKHDMMNYSDVKIGEYINRVTYSRLSGRSYYDFKKQRTYRNIFHINDLIPKFINFETQYLKDFLEEIRSISFKPDDKFERILEIGDISVKFAKGGLHSEDIPRTIIRKDGHVLVEKDVGGMYPASIINNELYPQHLGVAWTKGIKETFDRRSDVIKPKLTKLDRSDPEYALLNAEQAAIKLSNNGGGFGKTGSSFSWQYDPMVIMRTTFIGQLSLIMLMERFDMIGVKLISANTDGVVIQYPNELSDEVDKIHKEWESITRYVLEDTFYSRIFYTSVNDYIAEIVSKDNYNKVKKIKFKGDFEIDKDFHKDHSHRIVPIAIARACIHGIPPEETIMNHLDTEEYNDLMIDGEPCRSYGIFDFCGAKRARGGARYDTEEMIKGSRVITELPKTNRYFVSNEGVFLRKILPPLEDKKGTVEKIKELTPNQMSIFDIVEDVRVDKERVSYIEAGHKVTMFNKKFDGPYDINYDYYIKECNKILEKL